MNEWPFKYFTKEEFACPCCGQSSVKYELVAKLDEMRETLGFPLKINSGYRCAKHNKEVGGKEDSEHLKGEAADIAIGTSRTRYVFLTMALKRFKRIGIAKTFVHVGISKELPELVVWLY